MQRRNVEMMLSEQHSTLQRHSNNNRPTVGNGTKNDVDKYMGYLTGKIGRKKTVN